MRYLGYQRLGTMPILARNDGYQFGPTNRTHPELGHHNWRVHIPNIQNSLVRKTMAANGTYQTKLAKKCITFRRGKTKVRVSTQPHAGTSKEMTPLYTESINMLDGLADDDVDRYLDEHPKIVPLFEVDIAEAVTPYVTYKGKEFDEPNHEAIRELR